MVGGTKCPVRDLLAQSLGESLVVPLVVEQRSSSVAAGDDLVDRPAVLDTVGAGPAGAMTKKEPRETRSLTRPKTQCKA